MKKKIGIIGAGPGGLSTAMILAHRGYDVEVFEKWNQVGGRNGAIELKGFRFDIGPTFLMMKEILDTVFKLTDRDPSDYMEFVRLSNLYALNFGDLKFVVPDDKDELLRRIKETFSEDATTILKFFSRQKKALETFMPILERPQLNVTSYLHPTILKALPFFGSLRMSVYEELSKYFKDDKLRLCFTFQAKYLGMSPKECPAFFNIIPYIEHYLGLYHVTGGLNKISEAMAKVVKEEGGKIYLGTAVKKLIFDGKSVIGIELEDGGKKLFDDVVINADFAYSMTHIVPRQNLKKYTPKKLKKKNYSCSVYMIYLGLSKRYDHLEHHNIFFSDDYWNNLDEISNKKVISWDPSIYVQNASITDKTLAPKGKSALYVLVPVTNNTSGIDWAKENKRYREKILDILESRAKLKDIRKHIEVEHIITPQGFEDAYNVYEGAVFNLAHTFNQMLYMRPHNRFEEFDNCYLVGGGTHPGSGLPTIFQSGIIAADLISEHKQTRHAKSIKRKLDKEVAKLHPAKPHPRSYQDNKSRISPIKNNISEGKTRDKRYKNPGIKSRGQDR